MDKKVADIGSIVRFVINGENELTEVKLVEKLNIASENEVSKNSTLGEALMFCHEGDTITVKATEPYKIKIINIVNPFVKQKYLYEIVKPKDEPVLLDNFILADTTNHANYQSTFDEGLITGHAYGKKAKDVYCEGIRVFGWDYSKLDSFCSQKLLYSKNCSKEGYSVWFLPYSNMNNYKNNAVNWIDFINSTFDTIKEVWINLDDRFYNDKDKRITFAKQKNGQYLYLGIFQATEIDDENQCKIYHKLDGNYGC